MFSKSLGKTGVSVPEIGLGTWHYHGGTEPLRRGIEAGAKFVDTAESYGTEAVVGEVLKGIRDQVFLATKVSPGHLRRADVLAAADRSLRELKTDRIDLYQIHEPNGQIPIEETMGAMEELVDAGKVRFIGVSNFSVAEMQRAQKALRKHPLVANQVRYNLVDRTIETELLPYCETHNILVIAYSPLGRELQRVRDGDATGVLNAVAQQTGKTVPQVILNWVLRRQSVVAIPKGNSVAHVIDVCGASGWRLSDEQFRLLEANIKFRRRSRVEILLRRMIPGGAGPLVKKCIRILPSGLRRRVS
jgi:diketogulonate reductase-like aldo/keto reductase